MRAILTALTALLLGGPAAATTDLYDWMGPAPVVLVGDVIADDSRFTEVRVTLPLRGGLAPGTSVAVDVRGANRDRDPGTATVELTKDRRYLLLLRPAEDRRGAKAGAYSLVRGPRGAREVPLETGTVLEAAAARLVEIQDRRDLDAAWRDLGAALVDPNPILAETALDQHLKFRRGDPTLLAPSRTLLLSSSPSVRARAAALTALVLGRGGLPDEVAAGAIADLTATARRDADPTVREAATVALGATTREDALEALRAIARDDPDQRVRYAAVRTLFERASGGGRVD